MQAIQCRNCDTPLAYTDSKDTKLLTTDFYCEDCMGNIENEEMEVEEVEDEDTSEDYEKEK